MTTEMKVVLSMLSQARYIITIYYHRKITEMKVHSSKTLKCFFKCFSSVFQVFLKCFSSIIINSLLLNDGLNSTVQIYSKFIRNT